MADAAPAQGIVAEDAPQPRKGRLGRILLPLLLLVAGAAAGFAGGLFAPRLLPGLVPTAISGAAAAGEGGERARPKVAPLEYLEIDNSFTANLRDSGRFIQVRIAVSTHGGKPVIEALERHRLAVIAVVLDVLAQTGEAELNAPGGREALTRRIRMAINDLLQRKSGIAGIDDVYLTSFVMQ